MEYILPDGSRVRLMEPSGAAGRRASFTNAAGGPINPFTGKPVQPPPPKGWSNEGLGAVSLISSAMRRSAHGCCTRLRLSLSGRCGKRDVSGMVSYFLLKKGLLQRLDFNFSDGSNPRTWGPDQHAAVISSPTRSQTRSSTPLAEDATTEPSGFTHRQSHVALSDH